MVVNYNYEGATVAIGQPERHKWDWEEAFWIYFGYWLLKKKSDHCGNGEMRSVDLVWASAIIAVICTCGWL